MNRHAARIGMGLVFCLLCGGASAELSLELIRTAEGLYEGGILPPGADSIDFVVTINATGDPEELKALAVEERLPEGLVYVSVDGEPAPDLVRFNEDTGVLQFAWITPPDTFPLTFRYRVNLLSVPQSSVRVTGKAIYRTSGTELQSPVHVTTLNLAPCLTFTRNSPEGCYTPGANHRIRVEMQSECSEEITALGMIEQLPEGFTFVELGGDVPPGEAFFDEETGELSLLWVDIPAFPFSFNYVVAVPAEQDGNVTVKGSVLYRNLGEELRSPEVETTLCGEDISAPELTLLGDASMFAECGQRFIDPGAAAFDNVDGNISGEIEVTGSVNTSELGTYQLVYHVSDFEGNEAAPLTRTVQVVDRTRPLIFLHGAAELTIQCGSNYVDPGAHGEDSCEGDLGIVNGAGVVDTASPGTYTLTYNIADSEGNPALTATRVIHVNDEIRPEIVLLGGATMTVECGMPFADPGASAMDNCDGILDAEIAASGVVNTSRPAVYTRLYNVTDAAGNAARTAERRVIVVDRTAPTITLVGAASVAIECGAPYVDAGATAVDSCAGDLTGALARVSTVDISEPGEYTVTYNVSDGSGNEAAPVSRTVTVEDTTPPVIALRGSATLDVLLGGVYTDRGATATDACEGSLSEEIEVVNNVNVNVVGSYGVTFDVTDSHGNAAATVTRTVRVVDNVAPELQLLGDAQVIVDCGSGEFDDPGATATDNADGDLSDAIVITGTVDTTRPGSYELHYDVQDASGNAAIRQTRVVVVRNAPAALLAAEIISPAGDVHVPAGTEAVQVILNSSLEFVEGSGCPEGVLEMTYTLDGAVAGTSTDFGRGFPLLVTLAPGQHAVSCTARALATDSEVESTEISFAVVAAADADLNGIADDPFAALRVEGESWAATVEAETCLRSVRMVTWEGDCPASLDDAVTLALPLPDDASQTIVVSAPRVLVGCGEQGILLVSIACDLESLLGADVAGALALPPPNFVDGGAYFEISLLVSADGGDTFSEVDEALLEAHPVTLALSGLKLSEDEPSTFYRHPTSVAPVTGGGVQVLAEAGDWTADALTNVNEADGVLSAQTTSLSVFAPFAVDEDGPVLRVEPSVSGSFLVGSASVGARTDAILTVRNVGTETLTGAATLTNNPDGVFSIVGQNAYTLEPNGSQTIRLRFTPNEASAYVGSIRFTGGLNGPLTVQLRGNGLAKRKPFPFLRCGGQSGTAGGALGDMLAVLGMMGLLSVAAMGARHRRI